jgi:hypothetical protein
MPESILSARTSSLAPTEWLLARLTDPTRAAAIYGDLTEMAASRGRLWFWTAYLRTLVTFGWRTPVAFLTAYAFSTWVAIGAFPTIHSVLRSFYRHVQNKPHQAIWNVFNRTVHHTTAHFWQIPLGDSLIALWFILPFVLVRFGLRDRLTQLASAIFLLTIPYFSLDPAAVNFAGLVTAAIILAVLSLRTWRRPMIVLAASVVPIAASIFLSPKVWFVFVSRGYGFNSPQLQWAMALYRAVELCIAAILCSFLYARFLQKKPAERTIA